MKYTIRIWALGLYPEIEITQIQFDEIKQARNCLSAALSIEEKYELLLSNYLDLEKECLNVISDYMVRHIKGYEDFFDIRLLFNRKIVNLLTSAKLYNDQIEQHVKACLPFDTEIENKVKSLFSTEYESFFEYRFMYALRNYVQHRGLAVHSTTFGGKNIDHEEDWEQEYKISVFTHKLELESDNAFKRQVTNEMPEKVDLIYASRAYIESISKVHCEIRNIIAKSVEESRDVILNAITDYKTINEGESLGLNVICSIPKEPIDEIVEKFPLVLDWDDIRLSLLKTNSNLVNLKKRYVSSSAYNKI